MVVVVGEKYVLYMPGRGRERFVRFIETGIEVTHRVAAGTSEFAETVMTYDNEPENLCAPRNTISQVREICTKRF